MDELEFVRRFVEGDKRSRNQFIDKYLPLIYGAILGVFKLKGRIPANQHLEDIFQELFRSLIENNCSKIKSFKGLNGCSFHSWLKQVAINFTIDYIRRLKINISIDEENEDGQSLKDILSENIPLTDESLNFEEKINVLKECISGLERREQYFIELHFNRGIKLEKLKKQLRLSRGAIDMHKSRIIGKLRNCFKRKGFWLEF